jgi:outer membrane protein, multidrug efflux system
MPTGLNFVPPRLRAAAGRLRLTPALWAVALLTGCTLGPDYKRPEAPVPPVFRTPMPDAADVANTDWWKAFGDPQLDALIEAALAANEDLALAAARIEEVEARLRISESRELPEIGYSMSGQRERRSQERPNGLAPGRSASLGNYEISAQTTWELDLWGRVKRANEAARAELLATQEGRRAVMLTVASGVATSYIQLVSLDRRLAIVQALVKNRSDALALEIKRHQGGAGTAIAVAQARALAEAAAAEVPPIEREIAQVEHVLAALLARHAAAIPRRSMEGLALLQLPQGVPADVLTRRPDVLAAEQALVAANARIGIAKAAYYPVISLNAILGVAADDPRWLTAQTAFTGNYGAGLVGPLFTAGRIEAGIREAEALSKQAAVRFGKALRQAVLEVEDALAARARAVEREQALGRQLGHQEEVLRLVRLRFEGGRATQADVLDAEQRVHGVRVELAAQRRDTLLAIVGIYKAMGGGWMIEQEKRLAAAEPVAQAQQKEPARSVGTE